MHLIDCNVLIFIAIFQYWVFEGREMFVKNFYLLLKVELVSIFRLIIGRAVSRNFFGSLQAFFTKQKD